MMQAGSQFRLALTRDFLTPGGDLGYKDMGLALLAEDPRIGYEFLERHEPTARPSQLADYDAIISLAPRFTRESFAGVERLIAILRFGVGYDMVDVAACTEANVLLCITSGAVNYSVAEATILWMLALSHRMMKKDHLARTGGWAERSAAMGSELRDRTLGVVGLGGIGTKLIDLLRGFGMNPPLAFDPYISPERAAAAGARLVSLEELLRESDFVSVNCPLTETTRGLIGRPQIGAMKPGAFLINTARGGIVDEGALVEALQENRIAGAATDVFESEPVPADHPLLALDNVIVAPHCIAWTDELFRDIGQMTCRGVLALSRGDLPGGVVNQEVLGRPGFQAKLERWRTSPK